MLSTFAIMYLIGYPLSLISGCLPSSDAYKSCFIFGSDITGIVNSTVAIGWFTFFTIPIGLFVFIVGHSFSLLIDKKLP